MGELFSSDCASLVGRLCSFGPSSLSLLESLELAVSSQTLLKNQDKHRDIHQNQLRRVSEAIWNSLTQIQNSRLNLLARRLWELGTEGVEDEETLISCSEHLLYLSEKSTASNAQWFLKSALHVIAVPISNSYPSVSETLTDHYACLLLAKLKLSLRDSGGGSTWWSSFSHSSTCQLLDLLINDEKTKPERRIKVIRSIVQIHLEAASSDLQAVDLANQASTLELGPMNACLLKTYSLLNLLRTPEEGPFDLESDLLHLELQILRVLLSSLLFEFQQDQLILLQGASTGRKEGLALINDLGARYLSRHPNPLGRPWAIWLLMVKARVLGASELTEDDSSFLSLQLLEEIQEAIQVDGCLGVVNAALGIILKAQNGTWIRSRPFRCQILALIAKASQVKDEGDGIVLLIVESFSSHASNLITRSQEMDEEAQGDLVRVAGEILGSITSYPNLPLYPMDARLKLHRALYQTASATYSQRNFSKARGIFQSSFCYCPHGLIDSTTRMIAACLLNEGESSESLTYLDRILHCTNDEEWIDDAEGMEKVRNLALRIKIVICVQGGKTDLQLAASRIDLGRIFAIWTNQTGEKLTIQALLMELFDESISCHPNFAWDVVQALRKGHREQNPSLELIIDYTVMGLEARTKGHNLAELALDEIIWGGKAISSHVAQENKGNLGEKSHASLSSLVDSSLHLGADFAEQSNWQAASGSFTLALFLLDLCSLDQDHQNKASITACASYALIRWFLELQSSGGGAQYAPLPPNAVRFFYKPLPSSFTSSRSLLDLSLDLLGSTQSTMDFRSLKFMTNTLLNRDGQKLGIKPFLNRQSLDQLMTLTTFCLEHQSQSDSSMGKALLVHVLKLSSDGLAAEGSSSFQGLRAARLLLETGTLSDQIEEGIIKAATHLMEKECNGSEWEREKKWLTIWIESHLRAGLKMNENDSQEIVRGTPSPSCHLDN